MARKDIDGNCISSGANYENPGGNRKAVRFLNYKGECQEFSLMAGRLQEWKDSTGLTLPLTADDLTVTEAVFDLFGQYQDDYRPDH